MLRANMTCSKCGKVDSLSWEALELVNWKEDYLCYPCESALSALDAEYADCKVCGAHESVKYYSFSKKAFCSECGQRHDIFWGEPQGPAPQFEPYFETSDPAVAVVKTVCNMAHCRLENGYKLLTALRRLVSKDKEIAALIVEGMAEIAREGITHEDYADMLQACCKRLERRRKCD